MVAVLDLAGLLVIVLVNSAVTALMTRFFRVRLDTRWGSMLYSLLLCPVVLVILVLFFSGVLGFGVNLGSSATVVTVTILLPLALGLTFDYVWMPAPDDVELPETMQQ
jgi:uncharacterized membrane protein